MKLAEISVRGFWRGKAHQATRTGFSIPSAFTGKQMMARQTKDQRSRKVEAIQVHHLVPGRDKVVGELLLSVGTSVNFRQGAELGV